MVSKRCVMGHVVVTAVVGVLFACSSDSIDQKSDEGSGGAGSSESPRYAVQAFRYDPERDCFWDRETIDDLYLEEQYVGHESMGLTKVCVISPEGDAYVQATGASVAVVQTDSTAGWKLPAWVGSAASDPFVYSEFSPEDQALCGEALYGWGALLTPINICEREEQTAGGAGSGGYAGAAGSISSGGESSGGGSAGAVLAGAGGVLVEGDAGAQQGGTGNGGRGGSGGAWSCINPACEGLAEEPCVDAGCSPYYGEPWMEPGVTRYAGCITPFEQRSDDCESPVMAEICGGPAIGTQDCWMFVSGTVPDGWVILEEAAGCESIPECGGRPPVPPD